jgi:hypothetical protein
MTITFLDLDTYVNTDWHRGPPPSVGWWPASIFENSEVLRWWNGQGWSYPVDKTVRPFEVTLYAQIMSNCQRKIKWQFRPTNWPMHSHT